MISVNNLQFPYETKYSKYFRNEVDLDLFEIKYYIRDNFPESNSTKIYFQKKENNNFIGWLFPLHKINSNESKLENPQDQKNLEAYMDVARHLVYKNEAKYIESYFNDFSLEQEDRITIEEVFKYRAYLKTHDDFNSEEFASFCKNLEERNLVVSIVFKPDATKVNFLNINTEVQLLYRYSFFKVPNLYDYSTSRTKTKNKVEIFEEKYIKLFNFSKSNDKENSEVLFDIIPKLYADSFQFEYLRFSVLYQYIEVFIDLIGKKEIKRIVDNEITNNIFIIKKSLNRALSENRRIQLLFDRYSKVPKDKINEFQKSYDLLNKIINNVENIEFEYDVSDINEDDSIAKQLYTIRNTLFHNLRIFSEIEELDRVLFTCNNIFAELILELLISYTG